MFSFGKLILISTYKIRDEKYINMSNFAPVNGVSALENRVEALEISFFFMKRKKLIYLYKIIKFYI